MTLLKIPQPISGGVLLSYKCSAECRHCMYACSPRWKADWMGREDLETLLSLLARTVQPGPGGRGTMSLNHGVHFTGGEPFLNFELLLTAVELAEALHIPSTFVETNCSWCRNDAATRDRLVSLREAGLKGILISVNPFYAEYVPFERTERCIRISQEVFARNVMVYQLAYHAQFKRLGISDRITLEEYMRLSGGGRLAERVEMFLMGRAARRLRPFYPAYPARRFFGERCRPPFLRDWHNHFDNYGNILPGYCGGISLGPWRDLDRLTREGIDLEVHPVLAFLVREDVQGLLRFAQDRGYCEREDGYVSRCDLCLDLRAYLVSQGGFEELTPARFYEELGGPE